MTVSSTTSRADYTGNGSTTAFTVPFYFLDNTHVTVYLTVIATGVTTTLVLGTDYTLTGAGVSTGGTVTTTVAPSTSQKLSILRSVPQTQLIHYVPNDPFPAATHEQALDQLTMEVQQVNETLARSIKLSSTNTMTSTEFTVPATTRANKVLGFDSAGELSVTQELGTYQANWAAGTVYKQRDLVKDASNSNIYICLTAHTSSGTTPISTNTDSAKWGLIVDAAAAATSASSASSSASAAASSASSASSSATAAASSASSAATSATNSASSASSASSSASSAATSATNAASSYTTFHNQYYGALSSDPSTRPDGSSRTTGDLYWNTSTGSMKTWSGSAWTVAYTTGGGTALLAANNLSDVASASTSRTNLGLGTAAVLDVGTTANKVVQLDASGNLALTGTVAMGSSFKRNKLINGGMDVWQRATSVTGVSTAYVTADRWFHQIGGSITSAQDTSIPTGVEVQYSLKWTTTASASYCNLYQAMEQLNVIPLRGKTITVSAYVKTLNITGNIQIDFRYSNTSDAASSSTATIVASTAYVASTLTSWTRISVTGTVPADAVGLAFGLALSNLQNSGASVWLTGAQLEVGSIATPYERQIYSEQLAQCQRYYIRYIPGSNGNSGVGVGRQSSTTSSRIYLFYPPMRANPTLSQSGAIISYAGGGTAITSLGTQYLSTQNGFIDVNTAAVGSSANPVAIEISGSNYVDLAAEL